MKLIFLIFLFLIPNISISSEKINFLDLNIILNKSKAGQNIIAQLNNKNKLLIDNFKKKENLFKENEKKLLSQKNILDQVEFNKKLKLLQNEIIAYNKKKSFQVKELNKKKTAARLKLINETNLILINFAKENNISIILKKESILLGHSSIDITNKILKIVDSKKLKINIE